MDDSKRIPAVGVCEETGWFGGSGPIKKTMLGNRTNELPSICRSRLRKQTVSLCENNECESHIKKLMSLLHHHLPTTSIQRSQTH
ncbi:hypothetical protein AOLI_G00226090 [Acnodon oligacanthus]